ncbi:MAG: rod shape-determining protein MreC [Candidatus Babeliales bacterium]
MLKKKIGPTTIIYTLICFVFFFLMSYWFFPFFSRIGAQASSYIVYPALVVHKQVIDPIKKWFYQRNAMQKLRQQVEEIYKERDELLAKNIILQATADYFQDIAEIVDFNAQYDMVNGQIAQILVRHLADQAHFFLVNIGSKHGIENNMVAVYKNCLLGKVIEVYPWYSKVELITDSRCKIAGYCGSTNAQGIHEGMNNESSTTLSYVSHLEQIKKGDIIMSSGEGLIFPRGFALGRVASVSTEGLYHIIMTKLLVDLRRINYCTIIAKGMTK